MATFFRLNNKKSTTPQSTGVVTSGAGNETRTRDLLFTRQLLYQLSYAGNRLYDTTQARQRQPCYDAIDYAVFC